MKSEKVKTKAMALTVCGVLTAIILLLAFSTAISATAKTDVYTASGMDVVGNEVREQEQPSKPQETMPKAVGDVITSFSSPGSGPLGLAWDGEYLWNADWAALTVYKIDPLDGSVITSFPSPGTRPFGLTYDGEYLWIAIRDDAKIYKLDPTDGSVISSIPSPGINPEGLTWDGEYLWVAERYDNKIYKIDSSDGSIIQSFDWIGTYTAGLAWDGEYLWHCDPAYDTIYKLDPADGSVVTSFSSPGWFSSGLTWDGQYLWHSDAGEDMIYQIDVGYIPGPTVSISTDSFEYAPDDTMTITLDVANPTEESVMFQWYWGVPLFSIWYTVMSVPIPAGYDDTVDLSFTIPNWGPTPFGNVFYVHLLDAGGEVLDADCVCWAYMQLGAKGEVLDADWERRCECWAYMQLHDAGGEAMPAVDIGEEIMKTIERVELP